MNIDKLRFSIVTDIPTPYRVHLFNKMYNELSERNIDFDVIFMASSVPIRHWEVDTSNWHFPFKVARGIHMHLGATSFHLNPGVIWRIILNPPKWFLIGGSWNIPTSFISILVGKIFHRRECCLILWAEANKYSMIRKKGITSFLRKFIANTVDMFAVPGKLAADTIKNEWGVKNAKFLSLPNLVDEEKFSATSNRSNVEIFPKNYFKNNIVSGKDVILLWPARLHEKTKGILNFLKPIKDILIGSHIKILIAGSGPDGELIKQWLSTNIPDNVILLGQKSEAEMLELYSVADVLLLPSIRDPNPLSVIEGLWSSLPLLVSNHCGNQMEAVKEGFNGWVIDPFSSDSICRAVQDLSARDKRELKIYGENSLAIAKEKFSSVVSIKKFFDDII